MRVLSAADHDLFHRAFAAAAAGNWTDALALAARGHNTVARQLLQWRYALDRNSGATFAIEPCSSGVKPRLTQPGQ